MREQYIRFTDKLHSDLTDELEAFCIDFFEQIHSYIKENNVLKIDIDEYLIDEVQYCYTTHKLKIKLINIHSDDPSLTNNPIELLVVFDYINIRIKELKEFEQNAR